MSEPTDFSAEYAKMSEQELMAVARSYDDLTEVAQQAIRAEFAKRHLEPPMLDEPELLPEWGELVTVERFRDLTEATVARSALESAGVPAFLFDDNVVRTNWYLSNVVGGVRLRVRVEDESAAKELLTQPLPPTIAFSKDSDSYEQPHCPECGSIDISFNGASRGAALIGLYAAGLPLPTGSESWSCANCGARWEETED